LASPPIEITATPFSPGFFVGEADNFDDLVVFWNLRDRHAPHTRWEAGGFLPQMPDSPEMLEKLDLLLLTVPKTMFRSDLYSRYAGKGVKMSTKKRLEVNEN
jgi:hypothetical protein